MDSVKEEIQHRKDRERQIQEQLQLSIIDETVERTHQDIDQTQLQIDHELLNMTKQSNESFELHQTQQYKAQMLDHFSSVKQSERTNTTPLQSFAG